MADADIAYYLDFLPQNLLQALVDRSEPVDAVSGLRVGKGLREKFARIETDQALQFACELYEAVKNDLNRVLQQRGIDRAFIDQQTQKFVADNDGRDYLSPDYQTVIGKKNQEDVTVVGPLPKKDVKQSVDVPEFVKGFQVTLFGPPDSAKMAINAMNAMNRIPPDEPEVVSRLVEESGNVPRWGADNEDSQTPIMSNFLTACENLIGCFRGDLSYRDPNSGKEYALDENGLSIPIKRIPGLALPDGNHLFNGGPFAVASV